MRFSEEYKRFDVSIFDENQTIKQCKKKTPDGVIKQNDKVIFYGGSCLVTGIELSKDTYRFDSYDAHDNTCYIQRLNMYGHPTGLLLNVCMDRIKKIITLKSLTPIKEKKNLDKPK